MGPVVTAEAKRADRGPDRRRPAAGRPGRRGRPRSGRARVRAGLLRRADRARRGDPGDGRLPGGDLRSGAGGAAGRRVDEAIELVNANPYGNGTAIFTDSGEAARRFLRGVKVGMVGINVPIPVPMAYYSFGGWKDSLFGDKHVHGPEGVSFYTRAKVVTSRWPHVEHDSGRQLPLPDRSLAGDAHNDRRTRHGQDHKAPLGGAGGWGRPRGGRLQQHRRQGGRAERGQRGRRGQGGHAEDHDRDGDPRRARATRSGTSSARVRRPPRPRTTSTLKYSVRPRLRQAGDAHPERDRQQGRRHRGHAARTRRRSRPR